jgi:hypothetical protein
MSYLHESDQQCSRSFCSAFFASDEDFCRLSGDSYIEYNGADPYDCRLSISTGAISCTQYCGGYQKSRRANWPHRRGCRRRPRFYRVCRIWLWMVEFSSCHKNAATTEDGKEDVTGGDALEDSQAEGDATIPVESTKTSGDVKQANLQI